jgi:hypothetical protein
MSADHNSALTAPILLILAIKENNPQSLANALEQNADCYDRDARDLLIACLDGSDRINEIVRARKRGDKRSNRLLNAVPSDAEALPDAVRNRLVLGLRDGSILVRTRTATGRSGRPRLFWTKELSDAAWIEQTAIELSRPRMSVPDWVPEWFVSPSAVSLAPGAWATAISLFIAKGGKYKPDNPGVTTETETRYAKRALAKWQRLRANLRNRD